MTGRVRVRIEVNGMEREIAVDRDYVDPQWVGRAVEVAIAQMATAGQLRGLDPETELADTVLFGEFEQYLSSGHLRIGDGLQ